MTVVALSINTANCLLIYPEMPIGFNTSNCQIIGFLCSRYGILAWPDHHIVVVIKVVVLTAIMILVYDVQAFHIARESGPFHC